jgi:hypothetical protein
MKQMTVGCSGELDLHDELRFICSQLTGVREALQ